MKLYITFILFLLATVTKAQNFDLPPNAAPGKCYAKCITNHTDGPKVIEEEVYRYTGTLKKSKFLKSCDYYISPGYGILLIDKHDADAYKNEIELIGPKEDLILVKDTTKIKEFAITKVYKISHSKEYGNWVSVVCKKEINEQFIKKVQSKLKKINLYNGAINGLFDEQTVRAINNYQTEIGIELAESLISIKMLKSLKITVPKSL